MDRGMEPPCRGGGRLGEKRATMGLSGEAVLESFKFIFGAGNGEIGKSEKVSH